MSRKTGSTHIVPDRTVGGHWKGQSANSCCLTPRHLMHSSASRSIGVGIGITKLYLKMETTGVGSLADGNEKRT